ncbi:MAG: hypothetical protein V2A73_10990 [Pseudomonadota bacterium]
MLQTLVGRFVEAVTYHEIAYEDGAPMWNRGSQSFDSLDFGFELRLDDGSVFSFTWGAEFTQYNVSIRQGPINFGDTARKWDATERWGPLLGCRIVATATSWLPIANDGEHAENMYPQDVRLVFASGRVVMISAFESRNGELNMGMTDNITVFFDESERHTLR